MYCTYTIMESLLGRGFDIAGVEIFSSVGETTDWSYHVSVTLQEIRSA